MSTDCIFCKIIKGDIPTKKIYEDDDFIVFHDIKPMSKLGKALLLAPKLAESQGLLGFKTLINTGREGGQEVFHIHVHVFGGH
ncbi:Scavenger mRNA decapping enzyme C-term binding [Methylophilaceae bacterium]